ncbi:MAG: HAD-IA family hydrolase [Clostridia bacterium]|nr:HAD-IA family hydrolase [Clostridia bacterium]
MKNKLIIFDCFGVIFGEIAPVFFSRHFKGDEAVTLKDKYFIPADLGQITRDELFTLMANELNMDKQAILREWEELIKLNTDMPPVIEALGKKYDIALLSNAPEGFVEKLMKEYNLEPLFDKIFISSALKLAKPDPEIYRHCVSAFGKEYDEIYMIDDNIKNLEVLPDLGIKGVHFTSIENMLIDLGENV